KCDSRWIALPQGFASGALLASRGIRSAALVRREGLSIPTDLAHVLARWAEHGIRLRVIDVATGQVAYEVQVPKPSRFKLARYAPIPLMAFLPTNLRRFLAPV